MKLSGERSAMHVVNLMNCTAMYSIQYICIKYKYTLHTVYSVYCIYCIYELCLFLYTYIPYKVFIYNFL